MFTFRHMNAWDCGITLGSWKISHGSSLFISKSPEISFTGIPHVQNSAMLSFRAPEIFKEKSIFFGWVDRIGFISLKETKYISNKIYCCSSIIGNSQSCRSHKYLLNNQSAACMIVFKFVFILYPSIWKWVKNDYPMVCFESTLQVINCLMSTPERISNCMSNLLYI